MFKVEQVRAQRQSGGKESFFTRYSPQEYEGACVYPAPSSAESVATAKEGVGLTTVPLETKYLVSTMYVPAEIWCAVGMQARG